MGAMIVRVEGEEGILGGSVCRGGGVQGESKVAYGVHVIQENRLSEGILSYRKGNCRPSSPGVETSKTSRESEVSLLRDINIIPSRGSKEERIRIPLQVELYILVNIV
jgi:hypothetical protein